MRAELIFHLNGDLANFFHLLGHLLHCSNSFYSQLICIWVLHLSQSLLRKSQIAAHWSTITTHKGALWLSTSGWLWLIVDVSMISRASGHTLISGRIPSPLAKHLSWRAVSKLRITCVSWLQWCKLMIIATVVAPTLTVSSRFNLSFFLCSLSSSQFLWAKFSVCKCLRCNLPLSHLAIHLVNFLGVFLLLVEPFDVLRFLHDNLDSSTRIMELIVDCAHELFSCIDRYASARFVIIDCGSGVEAHLLNQSHFTGRAVAPS